MSVVQVWLLIGIPVVFVGLTLFTARPRWAGVAGVVVTAAGAVAVATVDQASGAVLAVLAVLLYAAGAAGRGAVVGDDPVRPGADSGRSS